MLDYIPSASTYADDIDGLVNLISWLVGFWFILSEGVFIWLILKFRAKEGVKAQYITGYEHHEKKWIEIPHALVIICDIFIIIGSVQVWYAVKQKLPEPDEEIRIVSQQWAWTFQHPGPDGTLDTEDDITLVDELHVKTDTLYNYHLESRDVMHDFSVPVFRLKQDAIPGRVITGWFEPTKTGEYDIQCAEMCGIGHGIMGARIFIETPEQHAAWMADPTSYASLDAEAE